jgi:Lrp/AsnC family leucine-responsive transcriptional regulator
MGTERLFDAVSGRILEELQRNGRITFSELARRVSLSPPAAAERVRRLQETGVITGFRAQLDLEKIGLPIQAFVRVLATANTHGKLSKEVVRFPEVLECHRVTGEEAFIIKAAVQSVQQLEGLVNRLMAFGKTVTSVVLSSPIHSRPIDGQNLWPHPEQELDTGPQP